MNQKERFNQENSATDGYEKGNEKEKLRDEHGKGNREINGKLQVKVDDEIEVSYTIVDEKMDGDPSPKQHSTYFKHLTIPKLNIEGEIDETSVTKTEKPFKRKVQICCTDEKHILSFYWTKIAKRSDEILLIHVIKENKTEAEATKIQERFLSLVAQFKDMCKLQGIICQESFPSGKPEEVICEVASQFKPHLLIIGSKLSKKHSSTSKYVIANSSVPVLMVPIVREHVGKGFTTVAAVAQAAIRFGVSSETVL